MAERVLVCGGRDFNDRDLVFRTLGSLNPSLVIQGGAAGADRFAREWAAVTATDCDEYAPDWRALGRAAGPMRNALMLLNGKPDLVIAFPGGRGTADMIRRARKAGVEVREIPLPHPEAAR